jgi:pimeloyl-ACP methyl ester carboxylesterase
MPGESSGAKLCRSRTVRAARAARAARVVSAVWVLAAALAAAAAWGAPGRAPMTQNELDRFDGAKHFLPLSDGVRLAYLDVGARDGTPLVLIHGYTDSARDWAPIEPLLATRFRLLIVDLRGQGASSKPDCCYTRFDFAYDVKLLLAALHVEHADIAGHSLGSLVAQTFAELWPEATRRLILISSTGTSFGDSSASKDSSGRASPGWLEDVKRLQDPIDADSAFMKDWWHVSMSINPDSFSRKQRKDAAAIPARVWRAIADQSLSGVDLQWMLPRITAPTLLVWGGRDELASRAGREALSRGIAHAQVRTFDALGHDLFWEDPAAVAAAIAGFLANP